MDPRTEMKPQEVVAVKQFRQNLKDIIPKLKNEFWRHDLTLLRFLRARDCNLTKAEDMIRATVEWRIKNRVDTILEDREALKFVDEYGFKFIGPDRTGCLGVIAKIGLYDLKNAAGKLEAFLRYIIALFELTGEIGRMWSSQEKFCFQLNAVIDLSGFDLRQIMSKEVMVLVKEAIHVFEAHYPEMIKAGYIVNAPKVFEIFWNLIKPLLAANTISKIKIYGSDVSHWRQVLRNDFDVDNLPSYYGGAISTWLNYKEDGRHPFIDYPLKPEEEYELASIPARDKHKVDIQVKSKEMKLFWNFRSLEHDVGFQVNNESGQVVVEYFRSDSHIITQRGFLLCEQPGKYTLVFDNSYSSFKSKKIKYIWWVEY